MKLDCLEAPVIVGHGPKTGRSATEEEREKDGGIDLKVIIIRYVSNIKAYPGWQLREFE
jgi:hypothetical protein